jgi:hypothetical protein
MNVTFSLGMGRAFVITCICLALALVCAVIPSGVSAAEDQSVPPDAVAEEAPAVTSEAVAEGEQASVSNAESEADKIKARVKAMMEKASGKGTQGGGTITAEEFDEVFDAMRDLEWPKANKLAEDIIKRDAPGQRFLLARIRYIYIYTLMTQFEQSLITMNEMTEKLYAVKGRMILQPWHPIKASDVDCRNMICNDPEWEEVLFTAQTNRDKSRLYWYEYVNTGKHVDLSSYNGKMARMGGILKDFTFNDELYSKKRSEVEWFLQLQIDDGYLQYNR